jgi:hypothetical protein
VYGTPTSAYPQPVGKLPSEHDGFAIASLVTVFFVPPLGIIFGHLSNHRAELAHRAKSGVAVAGLVLGYLFTAFIVIVVIAGVNSSSGGTVSASGSPAVAASASPATPGAAQAPAATTEAPSAPSMTVSQQQAVDSAQSYLSDGMAFSKQRLLQQLTSSFEGFTESDAEFAISYLHPDWDQQAVESAKSYLSDGMAFSKQRLVQQLTSNFDGFTEAQALYAISYLHPDWDQQAVESAKSYLQLGGFSRAMLLQQLTSSYDGFTEAQALYAVNKVGL